MEEEEILSRLCYYDKRNPDYDPEMDDLDKGKVIGGGEVCFCDNCFYGRTKMAEYILQLIEEKEDAAMEARERDTYDY